MRRRGIPHREDPTNADDGYARNYARHHVMPAMERLHEGAAANIARMTRVLREDEAFLDSLAADWLKTQPEDRLSASGLAALPRPVARRVLRRWLGEDLSYERTGAILALCCAGPSAVLDLPGRRLCRVNDALTLTVPAASPLPERTLRPGETLPLPEAGMEVECLVCGPDEDIQISFNTFCFSCAKICGKLSVAPRAEGDRLDLMGRKGTRSVKKMLIDAKIPRHLRRSVPVLRDEAGVLAVCGLGQSGRAAPAPGETYYKIRFREIREGKSS